MKKLLTGVSFLVCILNFTSQKTITSTFQSNLSFLRSPSSVEDVGIIGPEGDVILF